MSSPTRQDLPSRSAGFTLIELVIVIVIVGILMSVALPGFQDSMRKARRADAKAALLDAVNRQERFMLDRSTYTANLAQLGLDPPISEEKHYTVSVDPNDPACPIATCYVLTATPVAGGAQEDDTYCTTFSVSSAGVKGSSGTLSSEECW